MCIHEDVSNSEWVLCRAAMFFVAMSYAFMYGTLPQRLSAAFWSLKEGHGLPRFNSMNNKVRHCLLPLRPSPFGLPG